MKLEPLVESNMEALRRNEYPGRGIVIGQTPDRRHLVQVYWIMGRSENSRNRVFVGEGNLVRTAPYDESKVEDPSLIIYDCIRSLKTAHIVSNGDQTDTIYDALRDGGSFEDALFQRTFEPDAPNYTPRIAGLVELEDQVHAYRLGIVKSIANMADYCVRQAFNYETAIPGAGHCITTYAGNGSPLPSFDGEPYLVQITDGLDETAELYWSTLNEDNKISLLARFIDPDTNEGELRIINKNA